MNQAWTDGSASPLGPYDAVVAGRRPRIAVTMVTMAALVAVAVAHRSDPLQAFALAVVVVGYGVLTVVDLAEQRLPNRITLPLAAASALAVCTAGVVSGDIGRTVTALGVGLGFSVVLFAMRFGMGDVKLALTVGAIAGWLGADAVMLTVFVGSLAGAVAAVVVLAVYRSREVTFGFGPCLAAGSVAGMLAVAV